MNKNTTRFYHELQINEPAFYYTHHIRLDWTSKLHFIFLTQTKPDNNDIKAWRWFFARVSSILGVEKHSLLWCFTNKIKLQNVYTNVSKCLHRMHSLTFFFYLNEVASKSSFKVCHRSIIFQIPVFKHPHHLSKISQQIIYVLNIMYSTNKSNCMVYSSVKKHTTIKL